MKKVSNNTTPVLPIIINDLKGINVGKIFITNIENINTQIIPTIKVVTAPPTIP